MSTNIPARWRTSNKPAGFIDGPDEALWHAHTEAGKPADIKAFRAAFTSGLREGERKSPLLVDLVAELQKADRLIALLSGEVPTLARTRYIWRARKEG